MAMGIRNPYFPALANTWTQPQTFKQTQIFPTNGNPQMVVGVNGGYIQSYNSGIRFVAGASTGATNALFEVRSTLGKSGAILENGVYRANGIQCGNVPVASTPTIASGTVYQNTTASYQRLIVPVYASTSGTAGTAAVALGTSSTPSTIATEYISGSTSSTAQKVLESCATIPPGWYYSITLTGASFGTITQIQM